MANNLGNKETMAKNIRYYMDLNHVNAVDLCKVLNVSQSALSFWMNAKTYPRIDKIEQMAHYFGISKADLVEERSTRISALQEAEHQRLLELWDRADEIDRNTIWSILSRYETSDVESSASAG